MADPARTSWLRIAGASLAGLAAGVILLGLLELAVGLSLSWLDPDRARRIREHHALIGEGQDEAIVLPLSPLYGWGGWYERPPGALRRRRGRHGFLVGDSGRTTALDPAADVRIFVVGGSTVVGYPQPLDLSIPAFLERQLERRSPLNFNVVNAGTGGWYSVNELAIVFHKILPFFEPDAVVVLDGTNDVWPAVVAGLPPAQRFPGWGPGADVPLFHHRLRKNLIQYRSLQQKPGFALNQLLEVLGVRRYLQPKRYFLTGALVGSGYGKTLPATPRWEAVREAWNEYVIPREHRRRFRRRMAANPGLVRWLEEELVPSLEPWEVKQLVDDVGRLSPSAWRRQRRFRRRLRESEEFRRRFVKRRVGTYRLPPGQLEKLPCRRFSLTVEPYLARVRSLLGTARRRETAVLHALQPPLALKAYKVMGEQGAFDQVRTRHFLEPTRRSNLPPGRCWGRIQGTFFGRAGAALERLVSTRPDRARTLDLSRLFAGDREKRFADPVHYTPAGHRKIARVLADELESMAIWRRDGEPAGPALRVGRSFSRTGRPSEGGS